MNGYEAIASYLYQAVEPRFISADEFEFGNSPIGPNKCISDSREREAMREFIRYHDDDEMVDWIIDALGECTAKDFVADAEGRLFGYLISLPSFRQRATKAFKSYAADILVGKIEDDAIDAAMDKRRLA